MTDIISIRNVSKSFGGIRALDKVSFHIAQGEIHAIVGENGAGKSTLMKILAGVCPKDEGEILVKDRLLVTADRCASQRAGIGIVYQETTLCDNLSIAENIFLGNEIRGKIPLMVNLSLEELITQDLLHEVGLEVPASTPVGQLSVAQKQLVQIARVFAFNSDILIMDEPSSSLSEKETETLFKLIRTLNKKGVTIIYISHKLKEVFQIAHHVTILKDGKFVATSEIALTTPQQMVFQMVGREFEPFHISSVLTDRSIILETIDLCSQGRFSQVNIKVARGEVVAIVGLVGSGRTELLRVIFGIDRFDSGKIMYKGKPWQIASPAEAIGQGIALVPEDRKLQGLILGMSIEKNISLPLVAVPRNNPDERLSRLGILLRGKEHTITRQQAETLGIKSRNFNSPVFTLSGGNQQKVVMGKWLVGLPDLLLLDEPTKGIDVGAKLEIHRLIRELAQRGTTVFMVSSELPEVLSISDRIYVMREGTIIGHLHTSEATEEQIMSLATKVPFNVPA